MAPPRFSHGYFWLRNRMGMLVETHSWKTYPVRVRVTHNAIVSVLEQVAQHGQQWLRVAHEADARSSKPGKLRCRWPMPPARNRTWSISAATSTRARRRKCPAR